MGYILLLSAFLLFAIGSFAVVRGASAVARWLGFSHLAIGLIVAATAASSPELFVALLGAGSAPDLVGGGLVGGILMSLTLMLGIGAVLAPLTAPPKVVLRDGGALIAAALAFVLLAHDGELSRIDGALLLVLFVSYLVLAFYTDRRRASAHSVARERAELLEKSRLGLAGGLFVTALGLVAVMLGAYFILRSGVVMARWMQVPQYAFGLTVVALAVSLPEFFAIANEAWRRRTAVAAGQTFGAAIFGLTLVFGVAALVKPLPIAKEIVAADNVLLLIVCVVLPPLAAMRWRLSRTRGTFLILCYGLYLGFVATRLGLLSLPSPIF